MNRNKIIFITVLLICVGSVVLASHFEYLDATLAAALIALSIGLLGVFQKILLSIFIHLELNVELRTYPPYSHITQLQFPDINAHIAIDTYSSLLNLYIFKF